MRFKDARGPVDASITSPTPPPPPIAAGADPLSKLIAAASESNRALYEQQLQLFEDAKNFMQSATNSHRDLKATDDTGAQGISQAGSFEI